MELFIFIAFLLLIEVQCYKSPAVKVSPEVISESRSVKMICETPADVTVKQCNFYRNREKEKNIKLSPSCELDLTGAEVLIWAAVKSPASVNINCFYIIHDHGIDKPSSHSPAATVTVLGSLQKPIISVNDDDVQPIIACEIPLSVRADITCSLYTEDDLLHRRVSQTQRRQSGDHYCLFYVTGELFTRSVNSLSCDYSLNTEPEIRSPRSDTQTIRGLPQAKLTASASVIKETDTVQLSCENTEDLKMEMCDFNITGRDSNSKLSSLCQLSLTGSEMSIWAEGQSSSVRITCFYTVKKSQVLITSPHSDPVTVTIQMSTAATTAHVTDMTTYSLSKSNPPTSTTKETTFSMATSTLPINRRMSDLSTWMPISAVTSTQKTSQRDTKISITVAVSITKTPTSTGTDTWFIALVSSGVGVILTALICLCCFACKKRRRKNNKMRSITSDVPSQEIGMSSGPAETYSLITSVPVTSQPISVGLKHPDSHQDNTPDPTATSSFIMAENSIYQPSGVLVNKQRKEGNTKENENVYHLYCTIPDKPVQSNAVIQVYSLVN